MIGPGTGVVPFIAFAEERVFLKSKNPDVKLGPATLYFGCRNRNADYIYKEEIAKFKEEGYFTEVYEAFSREEEQKYYVQDIIKDKKSDEIKDLILNKGAYVFMCGASAMGKSVETILHEIIDKEDPEYLHNMKENGRFAKELWSA